VRPAIMISMVASASDTATRDIDVEAVIKAIRTGGKKLRGQIEQIRNRFEAELAITAGDLKAAKLAVEQLKKALPAVTWSGRFSYRTSDKLLQHSGLLCADLDELGSELSRVREQLQTSPDLFALFLSPTGRGLKPVFLVPADASKHAAGFRAVEAHVKQLTGLQIDESCKDVSRLCFMSYDPDLYHDPLATELEPLPEPEKPKTAFNSAGEVNLSERQRAATELLGDIDWTSEASGYPVCPGKHLHTTGDGERDCKIELDGAPTVHCFHNHCRGILDAINRECGRELVRPNITPSLRRQRLNRNRKSALSQQPTTALTLLRFLRQSLIIQRHLVRQPTTDQPVTSFVALSRTRKPIPLHYSFSFSRHSEI